MCGNGGGLEGLGKARNSEEIGENWAAELLYWKGCMCNHASSVGATSAWAFVG